MEYPFSGTATVSSRMRRSGVMPRVPGGVVHGGERNGSS